MGPPPRTCHRRPKPPVAPMEPRLGAVGERHCPSRLALAPLAMRPADTRRVAIVPRALDEQAPHMRVAGLRDRPPPLAHPAAGLAWREPEVGHQLPRAAKSGHVTELGQHRQRCHRVHPAEAAQQSHCVSVGGAGGLLPSSASSVHSRSSAASSARR